MSTHRAAVSPAKGQPFEVRSRPTPKPGPGDLLVEVKSVALNPADHIIRDLGLFVQSYPTVLGFDIAGRVLEIGEGVPTNQSSGLSFQEGITRIAAYAAFAWRPGNPDYGAFQERVLIPWQHAIPLPDESLSWNQAAILPVSIEVPLNAWDVMGVPRLGEAAESQKGNRQRTEALLVWGASSSVGSMGVQSARLLRDDPESCVGAVYATAGAANQKYVASLGADKVFDYKEPQVEDLIILAAKNDGLGIRHCYLAMGDIAPCQTVLKAFVEDGEREKAKIASAPPVPPDTQEVEGLEIIFLQPPADEEERLAHFQYCMGTWAREQLAKKTIKPSPEAKVVGKGLGAVNAGLNELQKGVSCTKLVVEISE